MVAPSDSLDALTRRSLHSGPAVAMLPIWVSTLSEGAHKAAASSHRSTRMVASSDGGAVPTKPFSASVTPPMSSRAAAIAYIVRTIEDGLVEPYSLPRNFVMVGSEGSV